MRKIISLICSMLALAAVHSTVYADPEKPSLEDISSLEIFVDGVIRTQLEAMDIPGATISIVRDGKLVLSKGYGFARVGEKQPVQPDTSLFRIGSTSKLFTWTAVMQLYEQGKLDLDADINTYLQTFRIPDTYDQPITMRHILAHTAGFEEGFLGYLIAADQDQIMPLRESMATYIPARINPPGKVSSYSNYAVALAGLVIENISGLSFNDYIKANIYQPLGMEHSTFLEPIPAPLSEDAAEGYLRENGVFTPQGFEYISSFAPAGSMTSTAEDMAKFMLAHLQEGTYEGAQILKPETAELMHDRLFTPDERFPGMAYGFYQEDVNGFRLFGHGGDTSHFHTNLLLDTVHNLGIFVSYNKEEGARARSQFVQEFYDYYFPVDRMTPEAPKDFKDRADSYAGEYFTWRSNFSKIEKLLGLVTQLKVAPTEDNTLLVSGMGRDRQFIEVERNLFQELGGHMRILFGEDEGGNISSLHVDNYPFLTWGKSPFYYSGSFNFPLLGLSLFLFVTVLIAGLFRWRNYKTETGFNRRAIYLSMTTSGLHLLFLVLAALVVVGEGEALFGRLPGYFGSLLLLPILASLFSLAQLAMAVGVWLKGTWGAWRKIHYTLVSLSALFMVWFYYFWNILGFKYF